MIVFFSRDEISANSSCSLARVSASRAESGSSSRMISGWIASARATATRWRMPPESSAGRRSSACDRPTMSMYLWTMALRSVADLSLCTASTASATLPWTVSQGISE
jgi:hypothetical protein